MEREEILLNFCPTIFKALPVASLLNPIMPLAKGHIPSVSPQALIQEALPGPKIPWVSLNLSFPHLSPAPSVEGSALAFLITGQDYLLRLW